MLGNGLHRRVAFAGDDGFDHEDANRQIMTQWTVENLWRGILGSQPLDIKAERNVQGREQGSWVTSLRQKFWNRSRVDLDSAITVHLEVEDSTGEKQGCAKHRSIIIVR